MTTPHLTPAAQRMYDLVLTAEDGISLRTVGEQLCVNPLNLARRMRLLGSKGLVTQAGAGKNTVWCTPERQARLREKIKAECLQKKSEAPKSAIPDKPVLPVRQIVRPAAGAPQPKTSAVRSVFEPGYA